MADSDAQPAGELSRPRVALALGSGGARGYAHIGVIHELHDRGYQIVGIAGSSMGALVGGLQAAGRLDEFADWARSLTQRAILRLLDPSISAAGVLRAEKILDAVRDILGASTIEQLSIPYTAVATDLLAGKSVWLQRGPVDEAIRASIAIPGVIAPHVVDGRLLADGGILDPLPPSDYRHIDRSRLSFSSPKRVNHWNQHRYLQRANAFRTTSRVLPCGAAAPIIIRCPAGYTETGSTRSIDRPAFRR
jgi:NTE family protein